MITVNIKLIRKSVINIVRIRVARMSKKQTLKKLKKLKKKCLAETSSSSVRMLQQMSSINIKERDSQESLWKNELRSISEQTLSSVASELVTPFEPVLSWFNGSEGYTNAFAKPSSGKIENSQKMNVKSVIHLPLKSPPCKRCPALSNGICKCAAKKFKQ